MDWNEIQKLQKLRMKLQRVIAGQQHFRFWVKCSMSLTCLLRLRIPYHEPATVFFNYQVYQELGYVNNYTND